MPQTYNVFNKNGRYEIGFFGSALTTNAVNVIAPYTNVGGTVISTNSTNYGSIFASWNVNTGGWSNWNPSPSIIPIGSTVAFAYLGWSSAYYPPVTPPFEILANTLPIALIKPDGTSIPITPNSLCNLNNNVGWWQFTHGADITSVMQDNQYGDYKITGIPTGKYSGSNGLGGWGIYILYENSNFKYRNANINATATGFNETVTVSNLITPVTGPVTCKVFLSSVQGDRGYPDSLLLNNVSLSGPWNPLNDFMNDRYVDYTGVNLQNTASLMSESLSQYGYYADQTIIVTNTIVKNGDTQIVLRQQNSGDWAGVSVLGFLTDLNAATLNPALKIVDKNFSVPGDTLTYTLVFGNSGSVSAQSVSILDTLTNGISFIANSIYLNGSPFSGDITSGITIPNLSVNQTATLTFKVLVSNSLPDKTLINNFATVNYTFIPGTGTIVNTSTQTNLTYTTIVDASLNSLKTVDQNFIEPNKILTYTITLKNTSNYNMYNTLFIDTLPSNGSLVSNSLNQDGTSFVYNILGSILPNTIFKNTTSTITYKILITNTIPNPILNSATAITYITLATNVAPMTISSSTNIVTTTISYVNLTLSKSVDKSFSFNGDTLTYTLSFNNAGNIPAYNLLFTDTISPNLTVIPSSFYLDGINISDTLNTGLNLGVINPNITRTLTFQVFIN